MTAEEINDSSSIIVFVCIMKLLTHFNLDHLPSRIQHLRLQ